MCEMFKWYSLQYEFMNATSNGKNTLGVLGLKDILGVNPQRCQVIDREENTHSHYCTWLLSNICVEMMLTDQDNVTYLLMAVMGLTW